MKNYDNCMLYHGNIIYSKSKDELVSREDAYVMVSDGHVKAIIEEIPEKFPVENIVDFGNSLIIPGFCDMHVHAPQFLQRGMGMDKELLDWLNTYTFPNESLFKDENHAKKIYTMFVKELIKQGTLHVNCFPSIHYKASQILLDILKENKMFAFTGKLNMDQNSPDYYIEETEKSIEETEKFLIENQTNSNVTASIIPRFTITCSEKLLSGLGELSEKYEAPVHSHMCEAVNEMKVVSELFPNYKNGAEIFYKNKLLGQRPTIMAHCIFMDDEVLELMKNENCMAVHCPDATANVNSGGIMPVKKLLSLGINLALGSDIGAGVSAGIYRTVATTIQHSKIRNMYDPSWEAVKLSEAFYMATKSGGRFFNKVGSFEEDYCFNALVINDDIFGNADLTPIERLERFCYLGDDRNIVARYILGELINTL